MSIGDDLFGGVDFGGEEVLSRTLLDDEDEELLEGKPKKQSLFNLIVHGRREDEEDEIGLITKPEPEYYRKRNIWTLFGCLRERNLANCCGLFGHRKNFYDCFGYRDPDGKLGYFMGVVIPVILDCFGVIIFLRLPMIVGNAGILLTILLFTLGYIICVLTVLSAAAIATSGEMGDGGTYYMISRTLGPVMGGSIGVILFIANVAGTALYVIGFVDTMEHAFPVITEFFGEYEGRILVGTGCLIFIAIVVFIGASLFSKAAFLVWLVLMASIVSVVFSFGGFLYIPFFRDNYEEAKAHGFTGWSLDTLKTNLFPYHDEERYEAFSYRCNDSMTYSDINFMDMKDEDIFESEVMSKPYKNEKNETVMYRNCFVSVYEKISWWHYGVDQETGERLSFESLFAIFFPAVTGILAGTNLSGDLKNPSKAISKGTFMGIFVTYCIYMVLIVVIGATMDQKELVTNYDIVMEVTVSPIFIKIGMFCATVSSAMTSLIGSSRILYALARDNLFPLLGCCSITIFKEPRVALLFTWVGVQACLFFGHLDVIAPFMTLFFVFTFVILNLACFFLTVLKPPNFRPKMKYYTWWTCLLGVVSSFIMMFYMDWKWAIACLVSNSVVMVIISVYTYYKPKNNWGNIIDAFLYYISTRSLYRMMHRNNYHRKYWSFKGLLFVSNPRSQLRLIKFMDKFCGQRGGMCVLGHVMIVKGRTSENIRESYGEYEEKTNAFQKLIQDLKLSMFTTTLHSTSIRKGIQKLTMASGIGAIKPSCAVLGWFEKECNIPFTPQIYGMQKNDTVALQRFEPLREHPSPSTVPDDISDEQEQQQQNNNIQEEQINISDDTQSSPRQYFTLDEYMETLKDIFTMKKSLMIARNFQNLDERLLIPQNKYVDCLLGMKRRTIDMWILSNGENIGDFVEPSISLILQLGYLLKTASGTVWKRYHRLRIMAMRTNIHDSKKQYKEKIAFFVDKLGMECEIVIVEMLEEDYRFVYDMELEEKPMTAAKSEEEEEEVEVSVPIEEQEEEGGDVLELADEDDVVEFELEDQRRIDSSSSSYSSTGGAGFHGKSKPSTGLKHSTSFSFEDRKMVSFGNLKVAIHGSIPIISIPGAKDWTLTMKQRVKILNNVILRHSKKTSVMFLPLPPPPENFNKESHEEYYDQMEILTRTSIPTFLVHSFEKVLYLYI